MHDATDHGCAFATSIFYEYFATSILLRVFATSICYEYLEILNLTAFPHPLGVIVFGCLTKSFSERRQQTGSSEAHSNGG